MIDYRRKYLRLLEKSAYSLPIPLSDYHVHHLDEDRTNNIISNLVLIHKDIHEKFHCNRSNPCVDISKSSEELGKLIQEGKQELEMTEDDYEITHIQFCIWQYSSSKFIVDSINSASKEIKKAATAQHSHLVNYFNSLINKTI